MTHRLSSPRTGALNRVGTQLFRGPLNALTEGALEVKPNCFGQGGLRFLAAPLEPGLLGGEGLSIRRATTWAGSLGTTGSSFTASAVFGLDQRVYPHQRRAASANRASAVGRMRRMRSTRST